jgi:hypothetical protein
MQKEDLCRGLKRKREPGLRDTDTRGEEIDNQEREEEKKKREEIQRKR